MRLEYEIYVFWVVSFLETKNKWSNLKLLQLEYCEQENNRVGGFIRKGKKIKAKNVQEGSIRTGDWLAIPSQFLKPRELLSY